MRRREAPRRLTGPSLFVPQAGAVIDVAFDPDDDDVLLLALWQQEARRLLDGLGWTTAVVAVHRLIGGASLAVTAPPDGLYTATEIVEWAWENAIDRYRQAEPPPFEEAMGKLGSWWAEEQDAALAQLHTAATARGLPCLVDSDWVTLGSGHGSVTYPCNACPAAATVPWDSVFAVPTALITGTNGKTTSTRLLAAIATAAGQVAGYTCTDGIALQGQMLEAGDCAGPGGARSLLRQPTLTWAALEVARGGLLRRGLPLDRANAALITNVAADHLGDFGVTNLEELAAVKWSVTRALLPDDCLVLNADDPRLVALAADYRGRIAWFSADARLPLLLRHRQQGGAVAALLPLRDEVLLTLWRGDDRYDLLPATAMPITLQGTANFNAINGLGAALTAFELGLPIAAIRQGLREFQPTQNGARGQWLQLNGVTVLVDFAHNPHGMAELATFCSHWPRSAGQRRVLVIGQAGDRDDEALIAFAQAAWRLAPDAVVLKELPEYRRGRQPGEVVGVLRAAFEGCGLHPHDIDVQEGELDAVRCALHWARPGDWVILLIHVHRQAVLDWLREQGATPRAFTP